MLDQMFLLNSILGTGTLLLEIFLVGIILVYIVNYGLLKDIFEKNKKYLTDKNLLVVIFLFSLFSSILTLVYSEYFGQVPCALCWFGRIFMYGVVVLSGIGIYRKEEKFILNYILGFSFLGMVISFYHHILQMTAGLTSHLPCPTSGGDCAKRLVFEYGHITFPWMAFVLFVFFMLAIFLQKKQK